MSPLVRSTGRLASVVRGRAAAAVAVAIALAAVAALLWFAVGDDAPPAVAERQFRDAGRAYGEGRFRDAALLYEELVRRGNASTEVFFNQGNAHLKDGRLGLAVLGYRKAWRLAPRDPDVAANLRLALQAAGAAEADLSSAEIVFTWLSEGEWAAVAAVAWWVACLALSQGLVYRRRRWIPRRVAAAAAVVTVAGVCGLWIWRGFERNPELVIVHESQNALSAPLASSSPRFSLPEGSVVRARAYQGEWVNVTHGQLSGWVRRAACAPVLLEAAPR